MSRSTIWHLCAALLLIAGSPIPANATADGCAVVTSTPDGFLNMRVGPGVQFEPALRLSPGDVLWIDTATCGDLGGHTVCDRTGSWWHVTSVRRIDAARGGNTQGWAHRRYLKPIACHER